uniref:Large ribosomal subunit protein uL18c n=1 Tax=Glossina austeni TaxID=7395 RepID=A0A1A9UKJ1_GLOAU
MNIPKEISIECTSSNEIILTSIDKQKIGQFAANIRNYKVPDPYKDCSYVLTSASTLEKKIMSRFTNSGNKKAAAIIGEKIAKRALNKSIKKVAFDRSGFKYHGRIKALAEAARQFGLNF